jgi:hypothetical protein
MLKQSYVWYYIYNNVSHVNIVLFRWHSVAKFIVPYWGIKTTMALGCCTGPPAYVAWRAGTTTLCHSHQLYPPQSGTMNWASGVAMIKRYIYNSIKPSFSAYMHSAVQFIHPCILSMYTKKYWISTYPGTVFSSCGHDSFDSFQLWPRQLWCWLCMAPPFREGIGKALCSEL